MTVAISDDTLTQIRYTTLRDTTRQGRTFADFFDDLLSLPNDIGNLNVFVKQF